MGEGHIAAAAELLQHGYCVELHEQVGFSQGSHRDDARRYWALGHGLASLVIGGVLAEADLPSHTVKGTEALFTAAGDDALRCHHSVHWGWRSGSQA